MKLVLFTFYYCKLLISVLFGISQTFEPLGLRWRWRYWNDRQLGARNN
ncbi:MAG: hypothetical protein WA584_15855 [Pyrinomonadaceae bacterium]